MCAAPGSKTAQIVEAVHANDKLNEMPGKRSFAEADGSC